MKLNMDERLLKRKKESIFYYPLKSLKDKIQDTFSGNFPNFYSTLFSYIKMNNDAFYIESNPEIVVDETNPYCGYQNLNGFSFFGFFLRPQKGYDCYVILYLTQGNCLSLYIPRYGNYFDISKNCLLFPKDLFTDKEVIRENYVKLIKTENETNPSQEFYWSGIKKDINYHFKFILVKSQKEFLQKIINLNFENTEIFEIDEEIDYYEILELMYEILTKSYFVLIHYLYLKLDIEGVFSIPIETELSNLFFDIWERFEKVDKNTSISETLKLKMEIKKILEES